MPTNNKCKSIVKMHSSTNGSSCNSRKQNTKKKAYTMLYEISVLLCNQLYNMKKKELLPVFVVKIPNEFLTCLPKLWSTRFWRPSLPVQASFQSSTSKTRPREALCSKQQARLIDYRCNIRYVRVMKLLSSRKYL